MKPACQGYIYPFFEYSSVKLDKNKPMQKFGAPSTIVVKDWEDKPFRHLCDKCFRALGNHKALANSTATKEIVS